MAPLDAVHLNRISEPAALNDPTVPLLSGDVEDASLTVTASYGAIFQQWVLLGWTAFGGPSAHIGVFRKVCASSSDVPFIQPPLPDFSAPTPYVRYGSMGSFCSSPADFFQFDPLRNIRRMQASICADMHRMDPHTHACPD